MPEPDPATIRRAAAGDADAFADLVRATQAHVWRYLLHLVGDEDRAADLTQDTFVKVYRSLSGFGFHSRFSTWLLAVARRTALDEGRRRARQARLRDRVAAQPAPRSEGPAASVEVRAAVAALPDDLREPLLLVEVFGLRYREAAQVLDVAEGTVASRIFRARQALTAWFAAGEATDAR